jgi:anti-sigma-K factor RskA
MSSECQSIEPLLPAYAVGSLEGDDVARVESHLPACPNCRALLSEYRSVAEGLLMAVPAVQPPDKVRRELIRQTESHSDRVSADNLPVQRTSLWRWALAAGVAAVLLVNIFLLQQVVALRQEQVRLEQNLSSGQVAQAIAAYPGARSALIQGDEAYGTVVYDPDRSVAAMYAWGLPPLPAGKTYQVWLRGAGDERVSGGVFGSIGAKAFTLTVVRAPDPLQNYSGVGVTIEPDGGSPAPTGPNVLKGDF